MFPKQAEHSVLPPKQRHFSHRSIVSTTGNPWSAANRYTRTNSGPFGRMFCVAGWVSPMPWSPSWHCSSRRSIQSGSRSNKDIDSVHVNVRELFVIVFWVIARRIEPEGSEPHGHRSGACLPCLTVLCLCALGDVHGVRACLGLLALERELPFDRSAGRSHKNRLLGRTR